MTRFIFSSFLFLILTFNPSLAQTANDTGKTTDWLLVSADTVANTRHLVITVQQNTPKKIASFLQKVEDKYGVKVVAEWPLSSISVHCFVLKVGIGRSLPGMMKQMERDHDIRSVQVMKQFQTLSNENYKDDLFNLQTNLSALNVVPVHRKITGRGVKIAIIDTGIDLSHPDLKNRNFANKDFVGVGLKSLPQEKHGTAVAGVIAASNVNEKGIVGIAPNATVIGMRGCWQGRFGRGRCSTFSLARALNFAIAQNVDIINLSLGGPYDPLLDEIISKAVRQHGILVVAAYGRKRNLRFPADQPEVLAVSGGKGRSEGIITAPAIDILSTSPGGKYDFFSGSSVATAHVSAIAALMLEANKNLKPKNISDIIYRSSKNNSQSDFFNTCRLISNLTNLLC